MTKDELERCISRISLGSDLYDRPSFRIMEKGDGFLLQLVYYEPDTSQYDPTPMEQHARKWYLSSHSTPTEVVRTAYKAVMTSLEHRLGEAFRYNGKQIFNPHMTIYALVHALGSHDLDERTPMEKP